MMSTASSRLSVARRVGFTLVELLVVIGVVALLISLLLPVLNKARQAAQGTACLARMRELNNACFLYANENRGFYPPIAAGIYSPWVTRPTIFPTGGSADDRNASYLNKYLGQLAVARRYVCPGLTDKLVDSNGDYFSYRYNMYIGGIRNGNYGTQGTTLPYKLTNLVLPSKYVLFVDDSVIRSGVGSNLNTIWFRNLASNFHRFDGVTFMMHMRNSGSTNYRGVVNIAFADGHVSGVAINSANQLAQDDFYVTPGRAQMSW